MLQSISKYVSAKFIDIFFSIAVDETNGTNITEILTYQNVHALNLCML